MNLVELSKTERLSSESVTSVLSAYAVENNLKFSAYASSVIKAIIRRGGNCPCRVEDTPCPCKFLFEDIKNTGSCHCNLFVSGAVPSEA